jgi:cytoskeleton protein RodZ
MNETAEQVISGVGDAGPGRMLAQLRSERKLSVTDVAQRLKYGARQIEALEAEDFDKLPGATFVRGMIRGYAKLLAVDPEPLLKALEQRYIPGEISVDLRAKRIPFPEGGKRGTHAYSWLSLLALAATAGVLYEWHSGGAVWTRITANSSSLQQAKPKPRPAAPAPVREAETKAPPPPSPVPVAAEAPQPAPAAPPEQADAGSQGRIRLEFDSESWVEIKEKDGKTLISQLMPAGGRRTVIGHPPFSVVIGNAAAVRLTYNENPVDLKPYVKIEVARLTLD